MIDEKELILQSQNGNKEAFCTLMEAHQGKIYALCFRYMQNTHDASDAAQEAILKIYLHISKFRFASAFSTWAYRIAVNACLDMLRRRRDTVPLEDYGHTSGYANPDADVLYAEFKAGLLKAVASLPPNFKNMIILKDMEHKKYEEIAEILGISVGTVKSRLARAREKLKKLLQLNHLL
ncbi:MAG: sigma-70 family RNA polymerase sigma factor [Eubacteriales bacterium]